MQTFNFENFYYVNFVLENNKDITLELTSKLFLLEIDLNTNASTESIENQFQSLFNQY